MSEIEAIACDPARCPLCGELNECARAADPKATDCWCVEQTFPPNLLERVPARAVRRACICQRCLEAHREAEAE